MIEVPPGCLTKRCGPETGREDERGNLASDTVVENGGELTAGREQIRFDAPGFGNGDGFERPRGEGLHEQILERRPAPVDGGLVDARAGGDGFHRQFGVSAVDQLAEGGVEDRLPDSCAAATGPYSLHSLPICH